MFISLTAAVTHERDLCCRVFIFCNVECWLELEGKCILLHEHNVTERRESTRVSAELSERLTWIHRHTHTQWVMLLTSLRLMYSQVIGLFRAIKHIYAHTKFTVAGKEPSLRMKIYLTRIRHECSKTKSGFTVLFLLRLVSFANWFKHCWKH